MTKSDTKRQQFAHTISNTLAGDEDRENRGTAEQAPFEPPTAAETDAMLAAEASSDDTIGVVMLTSNGEQEVYHVPNLATPRREGDRMEGENTVQLPNPYVLEASQVLNDLKYEADRAVRIIAGIEHEIAQLNADATTQIRRIEVRRDIEIDARRQRIADLQRIVDAHAAVAAIQPLEDKGQIND